MWQIDKLADNKRERCFFDENKEIGHEFTIRKNVPVNSFYAIYDKAELSQKTQYQKLLYNLFKHFFYWNLTIEKKF